MNFLQWTPRCQGSAKKMAAHRTHRRASMQRHHCALMGGIALASCSPAYAVDGCQVLLCLAAPSWKSIPQCVPPIRQLIRDLARGKPFPTCAMGGTGSAATHSWASAPSFCPPQYTLVSEGPRGLTYTCNYDGAISVSVDNVPFARTWWSISGDSVTEFSPTAKLQLGAWDTRFDDELTAWLTLQPATLSSTSLANR